MVEELKLAIKIDDKVLQENILKEINNAEKMADKVVFTFKNVNFDDKNIEKKFRELQRKAGKNPIELPIDTSQALNMLHELGDEFSKIANIVKGLNNNFGTGNGIGNSIVDEKSLNSIIDLFAKMESHLGDMKKVFADVGDGEEFSPLLKMINSVSESVDKLSGSVKNIGLNMNVDFGSDNQMESKINEKASKYLFAYKNLFEKLKLSGIPDVTIVDSLFDFEKTIEQYDTTIGKIAAFEKELDKLVKFSNDKYGKNILKTDWNKGAWNSLSSSKGQYTKAVNELKRSTDSSDTELSNLFGSNTDLTEVITQLGLIITKLEEISSTASEFKNTFSDGFNVKTSVKEIETLTKKVKELEEELAKVKVSSDVSIKDTFQGDKIEQVTTSAKELDKILGQAFDVPTDNFSEILSKLDLTKSKLGEIVKITKQMHVDEKGKPIESYTLKDKYGSTEIYGVSSNKDTKQLLSANYVEYDAKQAEKNTKELLAVEKQITKEIENQEKAQSSAQQKKWQAFQKEQQNYINEQKKTADTEKNKSAYEELLDTIKQYGEVSKRIAKNQTLDGDVELAQKLEKKISELQKQPILSSSQIAKSERDLVNLYNQLETIEKSVIKSQKDSFSNDLKGYKEKLEKFSIKPEDGHRYPIYQKNIDELDAKLKEFEALQNRLSTKDILDENDIASVNEMKEGIDELIFKMNNMSAGEKGFDPLGADKALEKINSELKKNSAMSNEAKAKIKALYREIASGNPSKPIKDLLHEMYELIHAERLAGREGKSFMDIFKEKVVYGFAGQLATSFGIYDVINVLREGVTVVREFDTALTEMRKVSDETVSSLERFQDVSFDLADTVGTTAKQIQNSTADYMRLGESLDEATESARVANILLNVSEFDNIDDATSSLVSMGQAYKDLDKIEIVDKLNEVGNNYAISTDELAVAMQKSAATLSLMGNSIDETASMITTANSVLQDADTVSAGLRTISLRIVGKHTMPKHIEIYGCYKYAS